MAGGLVGTAYVKVTPDTSQFGNQLANGVASPAQNAGRTITQRIGDAIGTGVPRVASRLSSGFDTAFNAASTMASTAGSRISRGVGSALTGLMGPIGRMRDGFLSSEAASSAFSGLSGTIGGKLRGAVDMVARGFNRIRGRSSEAAETATTGLNNTRRSGLGLGKLLGGIAIGSGLITIGKQAFQAASGIQDSKAALTGMYGSGTQAADMLGRVRDIAAKSPLSFQAYSEGAESLAYMGIKGGEAQTILGNLGDTLVGAGKGSDALQTVNEALLNMQSQGKLTAQDINRISQAGVPAWEALAKQSGVSMTEIRKQVTSGKLDVNDMLSAIKTQSGPTFQRLAAAGKEAGGTVSNTFARVKDNFLTNIGFMAQGGMTALAPMIGQIGDAVNTGIAKLPGILAQVGTYLAPVGQAFATVWQAAQPFLQGIGAGFVLALQGIGEIIQSVVGPALQWLAGLFQSLMEFLGPVAPILGGLVGAFAGATVALKGMATAITVVKTAWKLLSLAFAGSPIGFVATAIIGLIAAFVALWNKSESFRNFWIGLWEGIKSVAMAVWNALKSFFSTIFNAIVGSAKAVWNGLKAFFVGLWNGIVAIGKGIWTGLKVYFTTLWNTVRAVFTSVWNGLKSFLTGIWNGIVAGAKAVWGGLVTFFYTIPKKILGVFKGAGKWLLNIGKDLLRGLWAGVQGAAGWIWDKFKSFFGKLLPGWVKKMLGIGSPSKVFADLGQWLPAGMAEGIEDNSQAPLRSVQRMAGRLSDVATGVGTDFDMSVSGSSTLHSTIAEGIRSGMAEASIYMDGKAVARGVDRARKLEASR